MRAVRRAGLVAGVAFAALLWLASAASADLTDLEKPYTPHALKAIPGSGSEPAADSEPAQPASTAGRRMPRQAAPAASAPEAAPPAVQPQPQAEAAPATVEPPTVAPPGPVRATADKATPATSKYSKTSKSSIASKSSTASSYRSSTPGLSDGAPGASPSTQDPVRLGMSKFRALLGEMIRACQVAVGSGGETAPPMFLAAILGAVVILDRRATLLTSGAGDEDLPQFLYAGDVIAPG